MRYEVPRIVCCASEYADGVAATMARSNCRSCSPWQTHCGFPSQQGGRYHRHCIQEGYAQICCRTATRCPLRAIYPLVNLVDKHRSLFTAYSFAKRPRQSNHQPLTSLADDPVHKQEVRQFCQNCLKVIAVAHCTLTSLLWLPQTQIPALLTRISQRLFPSRIPRTPTIAQVLPKHAHVRRLMLPRHQAEYGVRA